MCSKSKSKPRSSFVNWITKEEAARKAQGVKLNKSQYRVWQKQKAEEFEALPEHSKLAEQREAVAEFDRKAVDRLDFIDVPVGSPRPGKVLQTVVDKIGDHRAPYTASKFKAMIAQKTGGSPATQPGFRQYNDVLRSEQLDNIFVPDTGAVHLIS